MATSSQKRPNASLELRASADATPPPPPKPRRSEERDSNDEEAEEEVAALAGRDSLAGYDVDVLEEGAVIRNMLHRIAEQQQR